MDKLRLNDSVCPRGDNSTVNSGACLDCDYCFGFDEEGLLICTYAEFEEE
ncbi:hypothetical protein PM10SUCC1_20790 [Propionigenium maris DSM 9537]|uniref:Uncharacterized protein n=1 Tax=Propionigenium maris DSM 9537 TaxID=1123000 RepID=A0A9W6GMB5_9FUSO|nr:hypothetical protein [Propionigenium maris]GLI56565.1 hypothetical protein PM10SUCC1_20790 [Propionigenium maris DSM 9537]